MSTKKTIPTLTAQELSALLQSNFMIASEGADAPAVAPIYAGKALGFLGGLTHLVKAGMNAVAGHPGDANYHLNQAGIRLDDYEGDIVDRHADAADANSTFTVTYTIGEDGKVEMAAKAARNQFASAAPGTSDDDKTTLAPTPQNVSPT